MVVLERCMLFLNVLHKTLVFTNSLHLTCNSRRSHSPAHFTCFHTFNPISFLELYTDMAQTARACSFLGGPWALDDVIPIPFNSVSETDSDVKMMDVQHPVSAVMASMVNFWFIALRSSNMYTDRLTMSMPPFLQRTVPLQ